MIECSGHAHSLRADSPHYFFEDPLSLFRCNRQCGWEIIDAEIQFLVGLWGIKACEYFFAVTRATINTQNLKYKMAN